ncbi:methyl-CpG-binding domain-containing protein 5 [Solanum lycopersicum]|uniref:MBD5 n=1 Tax=Solanum lycopersicum TaxID=4081 RepID=K4DA31_SOLLC|nr:methyl-CpG-binding domain-containing protein 5 [Solanum lycopersicum]ALN98253.1 MBD5 [Solanum lycopersicum]
MTEAASVSSIPPATVTGDDFRDDSLPRDPLLQSGTYIDAESNVDTTPNKGVRPNAGNVPDLTPAPAEGTQEIQSVDTVAQTVTPLRYGSRSAEVSVERPTWLPESWRFEAKVRTSGATAGTVDRYYYEPVTGSKFRSKTEVLYFLETGGKRKKAITGTTGSGTDATPSETPPIKKQKKSISKTKKVTSFYFDSGNPPQSVCWVQTDTSADTWTPSCNGSVVPGTRKQEWDAVFLSVSKLKRRNTQTGR